MFFLLETSDDSRLDSPSCMILLGGRVGVLVFTPPPSPCPPPLPSMLMPPYCNRFVIRDPRPGGRISLHTGDFRADISVCTNPVVRSLKGRVDSLYLDTTYCGPRHTFPDQHEAS